MVRCPSEQDFGKMLGACPIPNCQVMTTDIKIAQQFFDLHQASLKVKSTWSTPPAVRMGYVAK